MQQLQDKDSFIRELEQKKQKDINELTKIKEQMEDLIYQSPEAQQQQSQSPDFQDQSISQGTQSKRSLNVENDEELDSGVNKGESGFNIAQIFHLESIKVSTSLLNSYIVQLGEIIKSLVKEKNEFRIFGMYQQIQEKVKFYQNSFFLDLIEQVEQKHQKDQQDLNEYQKKLKEDMVNNALQDQEQIAEWKYGEKVEIRMLNQRKISKIRLNGKYNEIPEEIFKKVHYLEKSIHELNQYPPQVLYNDGTLINWWAKEQRKQLDELKQVVLTMRYCWLFVKRSKIFFSTLQQFFEQLGQGV